MRQLPKLQSHHVEAGDVILIGPTPIRVERVYRHASGTMLAACLVGRFPMYPRTFTCESLARYMDTCGRELPTEILASTVTKNYERIKYSAAEMAAAKAS